MLERLRGVARRSLPGLDSGNAWNVLSEAPKELSYKVGPIREIAQNRRDRLRPYRGSGFLAALAAH